MSMGGGGKQTVEQKADPWKGQQAFLSSGGTAPEQGIYQMALQAYNATSQDPYIGQLLAAQDPQTLAARQGVLGLSQQMAGSGAGPQFMQQAQDTGAGKYLSPESNPFLAQTIQAALDPVARQYTQQILPGIQSQAIGQGAYGGDRNALALGTAAGDYSRNAMNTSAQIGYENYAAERTRQMAAPQMYAQGQQAALAPYQLQQQVGQGNRTDVQEQLNAAFNQWQMQQAAPWQGLPEYAGLITSGAPGSSLTTNTTGGSGGGAIGQGIMGALGGAGLGAGLGAAGLFGAIPAGATGLAAVGGPWGIGLGAALGLAGGLFGR